MLVPETAETLAAAAAAPFMWIDYVILAVLGGSTLLGVLRGFFRESVSLLFLVGSIWAGIYGAPTVGEWFSGWISMAQARWILAFVSIFFVGLLVGSLVGYFVEQCIRRSPLSGTDRVLGLVFGAVRGALLVGAAVFLADAVDQKQPEKTADAAAACAWRKASLVQPFQVGVDWVRERQWIPEDWMPSIWWNT